MDDFIIRSALAGAGVALMAGPLGSFVVWRRLAFFGETLAHSALLGIALGVMLGISLHIGMIIVSLLVAMLFWLFQDRRRIASDTMLGIVSHASLSLGLVALAFIPGVRIDLTAFLFGDLLSVTTNDLIWIYTGGGIALITLVRIWSSLLSVTVHPDLAMVEGVNVRAVQLVFVLMIALIIAVAMKVVGILLITSLLIIPPATARRLARTPEQMVVIASLIGCLSVAGGLYGSLQWDSPAGPSIVLSATLLFLAVQLVPART